MDCQHRHVNGDNYGESCADCGKQLAGYGFGGWFGKNLTGAEICIHRFFDAENGDRQCMFCEKVLPCFIAVAVLSGE